MPKNRYRIDPKQSWFNWKCDRYRKCMLKPLNKYIKFHTLGNRTAYVFAKFKYINIIRNKQLEHYENNLSLLNSISCSKDWCKWANQMKSRNRTERGNLVADDFLFIFVRNYKLQLIQRHYFGRCLVSFWTLLLSTRTINLMLRSLKNNKALGGDGIPYEFYMYTHVCFVNKLLTVLNHIFIRDVIPSSYKDSVIIPLLKKGDPNCLTSYRKISQMDALCKIFNNII